MRSDEGLGPWETVCVGELIGKNDAPKLTTNQRRERRLRRIPEPLSPATDDWVVQELRRDMEEGGRG